MPKTDSEVLSSNVVVLIDQFTKNTVDSVTYDALSKHVTVITDIREITDMQQGADVVFFEPAINVVVTPEIIDEYITSLAIKPHLFYQSEQNAILFKSKCHCIKADYSVIDWNIVYAAVKSDNAILEPYQRSVRVLDAYKAVVDKMPEDMQDYIMRFHASYMDLAAVVTQLLEENARLRETVETQEKIGQQAIAGIVELNTLLNASQDKCNAYETLLSKSYDVVKGGFFPDRPRVLYIKTISHVAGMDTLISVLFSVLKAQYKASVKVVKLVDASAALQLQYIPDFYVHVQDSYNTSVLLENEHLLKLGAYAMMFDTLLLNRSGLEYLIVHDMRSTLNSALHNTLIDLRLNEMGADYAQLGQYDNVLSDTKKKVSFPWPFEEIQKHTGMNSVRLANHPTIVSILEQLM